MYVPFVDLKAQYHSIKDDIDKALMSVFEEGVFAGGSKIKEFEYRFKSLYKIPHCVALGNGTDALFATLKALGVGPGDEVLTPAISWISTSETITLVGAVPVFVDVHPETGTIDSDEVQNKITKKTKGIILVHLYGQAGHVGSLTQICRDQNLFLIEDCAHAHLTEENGMLAGTEGSVGCFSFYPTKNLGAYGDSGCVITKDQALEAYIRRFSNHGGLTKDEHVMEGMNSRMDTFQAAFLIQKVETFVFMDGGKDSSCNPLSNPFKGCGSH